MSSRKKGSASLCVCVRVRVGGGRKLVLFSRDQSQPQITNTTWGDLGDTHTSHEQIGTHMYS